MYLKSLVLKGFKSFADRSVLTLEPGITAIVGPNGSGKSNISDAVLWVLGERSARNLRGQAMDDIIFSGSAARKAVSIAEVDLVLDNSDGMLPVEFDEVVITRRMYRSGESDYLLNGVVSRRLDVLNILHDSGLGAGTHSIISQGSLDSILQSRPEDRRDLIEEAAGVLKHKQRKEKSERKLIAMDNHLARVRDVAAEVQRQLGPLERKAKRAKAYEAAFERLSELRLSVAVDDLRSLKEQWDRLCEAEVNASKEVEEKRSFAESAEQRVNSFQELMKRESEDAGEIAKKQRKVANVSERLESAAMLLRERRRAALSYEADMRSALDNAGTRKDEAKRDLREAKDQLEQAAASLNEARTATDELSRRHSDQRERAQALGNEIAHIDAEMASNDSRIEAVQKELSLLRENLSNGLAHKRLVEARRTELDGELDRIREECEKAHRVAEEERASLALIESSEAEAQAALVQDFERRDKAREEHDALREERHMLESQIKALEQSLESTREDDPALAWLFKNKNKFAESFESVSSGLKVSDVSEVLVESLLGEDLAALSVRDVSSAREIAKALRDGEVQGSVSVVVDSLNRANKVSDARSCPFGSALIDTLSYPERMGHVVEALLGDVVVCESRDAAFEAHAKDNASLRFVSSDGCAVWPTGKVRIFGKPASVGEGVLARERKLSDARVRLASCMEELSVSEAAVEAAESSYRDSQARALKLSQDLANRKGVCAAAIADEERASNRLAVITDEIEGIAAKVHAATEDVDALRPAVEQAEKNLESLENEKTQRLEQRRRKEEELDPVRNALNQLSETLSEAKLAFATIQERVSYAERIVVARERDLKAIDESEREAHRSIALKNCAVARAAEVLAIAEAISESLSRRMQMLDDAASATEESSQNVHAEAATARNSARLARNAYDEATNRMTQVQVEKSRLEVQVEAAVDRVVNTCNTPLDKAEMLPKLEARGEVEDEIFKLERRIKNMGTINPDAAKEYAELKERYDFLAGQLDDMDAARRSLNRIVRVIDERMKDDFVRTFEQVNTNFNEIFGLLFPGGTAHLSLDNPDDVEHSGVEVSAQPRGKRLSKMMLMSGGEKSLTALALLFAVYKTRATPFYILDEVEAALDDTNLRRLISYIDTLRDETQLIMITHQRRTMEMADVLFGVSMQADGVTKVISQKLERALENAD